MIVNYASAKVSEPAPGVTRKILAYSPKLMLIEHSLDKGSTLPEHRHPHEQLGYMISGALLLEIEGREFKTVAGDSFVIPGDVPHKVTALENSVVLDVFTPAREDYL